MVRRNRAPPRRTGRGSAAAGSSRGRPRIGQNLRETDGWKTILRAAREAWGGSGLRQKERVASAPRRENGTAGRSSYVQTGHDERARRAEGIQVATPPVRLPTEPRAVGARPWHSRVFRRFRQGRGSSSLLAGNSVPPVNGGCVGGPAQPRIAFTDGRARRARSAVLGGPRRRRVTRARRSNGPIRHFRVGGARHSGTLPQTVASFGIASDMEQREAGGRLSQTAFRVTPVGGQRADHPAGPEGGTPGRKERRSHL